ncbi:MAG TPA: protein phosphatase 2C domain-containing protein [Streptosporangiaceae bacterium]|nr:protein phosphatase 2C domain-containing protein [Streptosporangiaceae bacterium]
MEELLAIGEFSARSSLSPRMLRSYAAVGMLVPAAVDRFTGYRYYSPEQLGEAKLILLLRQAGVPVNEIAGFLRDRDLDRLRRWERELELELTSRLTALAEARARLGFDAWWPAAAESKWEKESGMEPVQGSGSGSGSTESVVGDGTLSWGSASARGAERESNQDALLASAPLFAVADGLGGGNGGQIASRVALDELGASFSRSAATGQPGVETLVDAARDASLAVWQRMEADSSLEGMGATLTAMAVLDAGSSPRLAIVSVGDSRAYLFAGGQLQQVTHDDSVVQGLIDAGKVQPEEWRDHPSRALLTRALGTAALVEPDISLPRVPPAGRVLLCTDGLTTAVDEPSMAAVLAAEPDPDRAAAELVRLAADSGGTDDTTVVVVDLPVPA